MMSPKFRSRVSLPCPRVSSVLFVAAAPRWWPWPLWGHCSGSWASGSQAGRVPLPFSAAGPMAALSRGSPTEDSAAAVEGLPEWTVRQWLALGLPANTHGRRYPITQGVHACVRVYMCSACVCACVCSPCAGVQARAVAVSRNLQTAVMNSTTEGWGRVGTVRKVCSSAASWL